MTSNIWSSLFIFRKTFLCYQKVKFLKCLSLGRRGVLLFDCTQVHRTHVPKVHSSARERFVLLPCRMFARSPRMEQKHFSCAARFLIKWGGGSSPHCFSPGDRATRLQTAIVWKHKKVLTRALHPSTHPVWHGVSWMPPRAINHARRRRGGGGSHPHPFTGAASRADVFGDESRFWLRFFCRHFFLVWVLYEWS